MNNIEIVKFTLELYSKLRSQRANLENTWQEVNAFVRPNQVNPKLYDSTAMQSAEYLTSALWSYVSNSSTNWFYLKNSNQNIAINKTYLLQVGDVIKSSFNNSSSGFYYKSYEFYADLISYGTAIFYTFEDLANASINYQTCSLMDTYIHASYNKIDTIIRKLVLSPQGAIDFFGYKNVAKNIIKNINANEVYTFLHITIPAKIINSKFHQLRSMPYASYYIDVEHNRIILESGYYQFPFMIARWYTHANEIYGQSPAMLALADIKMLNAMSKTMLITAQKQIDPPILAPSEMNIQGIRTIPGSVIYGGIDPLSGNQLIKPLQMGIDSNSSYILYERVQNSIKEAFFHSLLLYSYSSLATATEVMAVNEQKLTIFGSKIARIQSEFLAPLIKRQIALLQAMSLLPAKPKGLKLNDIEVEFLSSWNRYQQFNDSVAISKTSDFIKSIEGFYPQIAQLVDWKTALNIVTEGHGLSKNIIKSN